MDTLILNFLQKWINSKIALIKLFIFRKTKMIFTLKQEPKIWKYPIFTVPPLSLEQDIKVSFEHGNSFSKRSLILDKYPSWKLKNPTGHNLHSLCFLVLVETKVRQSYDTMMFPIKINWIARFRAPRFQDWKFSTNASFSRYLIRLLCK